MSGSTAGPWRVERLVEADEDGPEFLVLRYDGWEDSIVFPLADGGALIGALCHYLGVANIELEAPMPPPNPEPVADPSMWTSSWGRSDSIIVGWRWQTRPFWAHFEWNGSTIGVCRWTPWAARMRAEQIQDRMIARSLPAGRGETAALTPTEEQ